MASIFNPQDKEKDDEQQAGAPQQVGGGQSATLGSAGAAPAAGTKSGRFTNISNYLQANAGYNKDGGGLAGKIAGNINNQGNAVKQEVNQAKDQFNNAAQQNRVAYDDNTVNKALNDSTNFAQNDQNVDSFQKQLNAKYQGPQGIQNAEIMQNKAQNLQDLTNQTTTEGGRFGLLKNMFNKPSYTGGQQKLDNLLLQGNQGQLKSLTGTRQLGNQVSNQVNNTNMGAVADAQKYKDEANATAMKTRDEYLKSLTGFDQGLAGKADTLNTERQSQYDAALKNTKDNVVSEDDLSRFGLANGQSLYGLKLNDYLTKNNTQANSVNAASADDYNKIAALRKLAGDTQLEGADKIFDTYGGGYNEANDITKQSAYDLDKSRFQGAYDANKAQHDAGTGEAQAGIDKANSEIATWQQQLAELNAMGGIDPKTGKPSLGNETVRKMLENNIYAAQQNLAANKDRFAQIKSLFGGAVNSVPQYINLQPSEEESGAGPMVAGYTPMIG